MSGGNCAGGCLESNAGVNSKERDTGVVVYRKHLLQTVSHLKGPHQSPQEHESKC